MPKTSFVQILIYISIFISIYISIYIGDTGVVKFELSVALLI